MQILIRQANSEDAPLLAQLNAAVQQFHVDVEPQRYKIPNPADPALIDVYEKHLADEKVCIFIAEVDGEAAAYILLILQEKAENSFVFAQKALYIDQMSVSEGYRRHGLGHALMQKAFELAGTLEVDYLSLGVRAFNEEAIAFYEREGFETSSLNMWRKIK